MGSVVADARELAGRVRVVREARVVPGIGDVHRLVGVEGEGAERVGASHLPAGETDRRHLVLGVGGEEVDRGERHARDARGQVHQRHQLAARRPVEDVVRLDRGLAQLVRLVGPGHSPGAFHSASQRWRSCSIGSSAAQVVAHGDLQHGCRGLLAGRGEGIERALLVEVDQAEPLRRHRWRTGSSSTAGRTRSPAPRGVVLTAWRSVQSPDRSPGRPRRRAR